MEVLFDNHKVLVQDAVKYYSARELDSPTCSTVPLLLWLQQEEAMVREVIKKLGMGTPREFHLEYKVKPKKGKGKASQTDLFVLSDASALAFEAKWTESKYPLVKKWLLETKDLQNKRDVLQGWIDYIQPFVDVDLSIEKMEDTVYQMVHRAASACSQGKEPGLVYLQFTESYSRPGKSYIESDLRSFRNILGVPKGFPFYFVEILLGPVKEFEAFRQLKKGTKETDEVVRASINNGERLFTFPEYRITTI